MKDFSKNSRNFYKIKSSKNIPQYMRHFPLRLQKYSSHGIKILKELTILEIGLLKVWWRLSKQIWLKLMITIGIKPIVKSKEYKKWLVSSSMPRLLQKNTLRTISTFKRTMIRIFMLKLALKDSIYYLQHNIITDSNPNPVLSRKVIFPLYLEKSIVLE